MRYLLDPVTTQLSDSIDSSVALTEQMAPLLASALLVARTTARAKQAARVAQDRGDGVVADIAEIEHRARADCLAARHRDQFQGSRAEDIGGDEAGVHGCGQFTHPGEESGDQLRCHRGVDIDARAPGQAVEFVSHRADQHGGHRGIAHHRQRGVVLDQSARHRMGARHANGLHDPLDRPLQRVLDRIDGLVEPVDDAREFPGQRTAHEFLFRDEAPEHRRPPHSGVRGDIGDGHPLDAVPAEAVDGRLKDGRVGGIPFVRRRDQCIDQQRTHRLETHSSVTVSPIASPERYFVVQGHISSRRQSAAAPTTPGSGSPPHPSRARTREADGGLFSSRSGRGSRRSARAGSWSAPR